MSHISEIMNKFGIEAVEGTANVALKTSSDTLLFNFSGDIEGADSPSQENPFITDSLRGVFIEFTQNAGIKNYLPSVLSSDNKAIVASQKHLLDLIKYYEGDRYHYYEAVNVPYKDGGGTYTCGFGTLTNGTMSSEKAYQALMEHLTSNIKEVKRSLTPEVYEKLPDSLKEAIIDLCYNKGAGAVNINKEAFVEAAENGSYLNAIKALSCLELSAGKIPSNSVKSGLYRRSLSRMILATRDLTTQNGVSDSEIKNIKSYIESYYEEAKSHPEQAVKDVEKIYQAYTKGTITETPVSGESGKHTVQEKDTLYGIALKYRPDGISVKRVMLEILKVNYQIPYKDLKDLNENNIDQYIEQNNLTAFIKKGALITIPLEVSGKRTKVEPRTTAQDVVPTSQTVPEQTESIQESLPEGNVFESKKETTYYALAKTLLPEGKRTRAFIIPVIEAILEENGTNISTIKYDKDGYPDVGKIRQGQSFKIPDSVNIEGEEISLVGSGEVVETDIGTLTVQTKQIEAETSITREVLSQPINSPIDTTYTIKSGEGYRAAARYFYPDKTEQEYTAIALQLEEENGIPNKQLKVGTEVKALEEDRMVREKQSNLDGHDSSPPVFKTMLESDLERTIKPIGKSDFNLELIEFSYEVKSGNNFYRIAEAHDIDCKTLEQYNAPINPSDIKSGQIIKIPKIVYNVKEGENDLNLIATKFGITPELLASMNGIDSSKGIDSVKKLVLPGYAYTIKSGDNLTKIAQKVGVSRDVLMKINGLTSDKIKPDQQLVILFNDVFYNLEATTARTTPSTENVTKPKGNNLPAPKALSGRVEYSTETPEVKDRDFFRVHKQDGKVVATRYVFEPTTKGEDVPLRNKTIIVNAGHGYKNTQIGLDVGVKGANGVEHECYINYDNAMWLKDELCELGAKVIFLQGGVDLIAEENVKIENKADYFISIHVNGSGTEPENNYMRIQYYKNSSNNNISKQGALLSLFVEEQFETGSEPGKDIVKPVSCNAKVLRTSPAATISVLYEMGFMNHSDGRSYLKNEKAQKASMKKLANAIAQCEKEAKNYKVHVVSSGEVLSTIATKYGTTMEELCKLNNLGSVLDIMVGQVLRVPK